MPDTLTKAQRSYCMSRIRSKWTAQEKKVHNHLKGIKIKHKMHPNIAGHPDVLLSNTKTAIFLHGCFWHKCPKCYVKPKTSKKYWNLKMKNNVSKDRKNAEILKSDGYKVLKIWEHQVNRDFDNVFKRLMKNGS